MRVEANIGDPGGVRVPHPEILPGLYRIHESGARHFGDALCLYTANRAQDAIPSFVLSVEEYLKGIYLAISHTNEQNVSAAEWAQLRKHEFKLQCVKPRLDGTLGEAALERIYGDYSHGDPGTAGRARPAFSSSMDECDREVTELTRALQALKLACVYHDWDDRARDWGAFASLPAHAQRSLAFHAMHISKCYHDMLAHSVGDGLQLPCMATCSGLLRAHRDPFQLRVSRSVMRVIQNTGSVLACPRDLTLDIINGSARARQPDGDGSNAHPLVLAISELSSELPSLRDGVHGRTLDDSGQTPDGEATMSVSVSMHVSGGTGTLGEVTINRTACDIYDGRLAMTLEAERIIGSKPGPEMSRPALAKLLSWLEIRPRALSSTDVPRALGAARELAEGGRLRHCPGRIVDAIRSATPAGWPRLDPQARNVICALFLRDPAATALGDDEGLLQKRRARVVVWDSLCAQKAVYDGLAALR